MPIKRLKQKKYFPILVLVFLAMIWGSSFILIKKGLLAYSPIQVGTLRIIFACLVLLPIALKNIKGNLKPHWKKFLALGLISNLIPAILFATAETELSSSLAGMLNALTPVCTIVVGVTFFKSKINRPVALGLLIGLTGSIIISFVGGSGELGTFNIYALMVIFATLLYGISGNMIKDYVNTFDPVVLISLTTLTIGPISLAVLLTTDFVSQTVTHPDAWISLLCLFILGSIGTALALAVFNKLIKSTSAVFASSATYLIPIVAVGWGLIDGEVLFPLHFAGMGFIILGVIIINKYK
ncbi:MAG: DMT family transporter [Melioribacteraceae bacterium]|nr:DMT family transporter [Melioribacteraceae bacterium]